MGTWVAVKFPQFKLRASAWDIVVDGDYRGLVTREVPGRPHKYLATRANEFAYADTPTEAARKLLAAEDVEQR